MKSNLRTVNVDPDLVRRAQRKLRRYGMSLDEAFSRMLVSITVTRGNPFAAVSEIPGRLLLESFREADEMESGARPVRRFATVDDLAADCLS